MNCHKLPSLPGLNFEDRLKKNHHVPQSFSFQNGQRVNRCPSVGIGGEPLEEKFKDFHSADEPIGYDPSLIYGKTKQQQVKPFRPRFVLLDKVTLKFMAFFRQHVPDSRIEHYRIRHVNIFYYLEDDTITVIEPTVKNCGLLQGRLVRRGKIRKGPIDYGAANFYTWKDFNLGKDIELQGIVFRIINCDSFTREYMTANGVELAEVECSPNDPVTMDRMILKSQIHKTKHTTCDDKQRRFMEYFGMILTFDAVLDEPCEPCGELMTFKIYFFLEDDTVAVRELPENRQGRDPGPMLLKRNKLPKNWCKQPLDYPAVFLNMSDYEVEEYYAPKDLVIGETIFVYGRKFLLLDCDNFTRNYYNQVLRSPQPNKLMIEKPPQKEIKIVLPNYMGIGSLEDSLASCYKLIPKPPKKDVVTYLLNANKSLRFGCRMDTAAHEDKDRKFILFYNLADGTIRVVENAVGNSGIAGGKFFNSRKVIKPGTNPNKPDYYLPKDLFIGALVQIYATRFIITSADLYVYRYMQAHPELFSPEVIDNVRLYHLKEGNLQGDLEQAVKKDHENYLQEQKALASMNEAINDASMDMPREEQATGERIPQPYVGEDEVKKNYHERDQKYSIPCNIDIKEEENIPSDTAKVRFLEPHEEKHRSCQI